MAVVGILPYSFVRFLSFPSDFAFNHEAGTCTLDTFQDCFISSAQIQVNISKYATKAPTIFGNIPKILTPLDCHLMFINTAGSITNSANPDQML